MGSPYLTDEQLQVLISQALINLLGMHIRYSWVT